MTMVLAPDKRAQAKRSSQHRDAAHPVPEAATAPAPTPEQAPEPAAVVENVVDNEAAPAS
jgi:hypothetical protein